MQIRAAATQERRSVCKHGSKEGRKEARVECKRERNVNSLPGVRADINSNSRNSSRRPATAEQRVAEENVLHESHTRRLQALTERALAAGQHKKPGIMICCVAFAPASLLDSRSLCLPQSSQPLTLAAEARMHLFCCAVAPSREREIHQCSWHTLVPFSSD